MSLASAIRIGERDHLMRPSPNFSVEGVPAKDAHVPWYRAWNLLQRAVDRVPAPDPWTGESLLREVQSGNCQLWIAWSYATRRVEGAMITRLNNNPAVMPNDRVCEVVLCAGERFKDWGFAMVDLLKAWGAEQGCTYLGGAMRRGWVRWFPFVEVGKTESGIPIMAMPIRRH